jgi:hypothetical protein
MPEPTPLLPQDPRRVGRYLLTGRAGLTARATRVYLGSRADGGTVVVCLLSPERAADPAARDRFTAEARAARQMVPYCATAILDAGIEGTIPFLVTEFVPGPSVAEFVRMQGPLPASLLSALAAGTATGLAAIHRAGLVHGQYGPGCVILSPSGPRVVLLGITPPYGTATPAADMREWARLLGLAASGHVPVGAGDLYGLPRDLAAAVAPCLDPDPAARPDAVSVLRTITGSGSATDRLLAEGAAMARKAARALGGQLSGSPLAGSSVAGAGPPPGTGSKPGAKSRAGTRSGAGGKPRAAGSPPRTGSRSRPRWIVPAAVCCALLVVGAVVAVAPLFHRPRTPVEAGATSQPTHRAAAVVPPQFAGQWSGTVRQRDPVLIVTVHLALAAGSARGTISYPALRCSGNLTLTSLASGVLTIRQTILAGQDRCVDGVITLVPQAGRTLRFTFDRPGGSSPAGILTRDG